MRHKVGITQIKQVWTAFVRGRDRLHRWRQYILMAVLVQVIIVACARSSEVQVSQAPNSPNGEEVLTIWWDKGFTLEEDEALQAVVATWEDQRGHTVDLSFYTTDELPQKTERALQAGHPPDILMSHNAERVLNPRLAWEGKLADVSDVIEPVKSQYPETVLGGVSLYNNVENTRRYYAIPVHQATTQIFYRRDLLEQAGRSDRDIPQEWDAFWEFWKQLQADLPTAQSEKVYALGLPISPKAGDTYEVFEQVLEAYDVQILDAQGELKVSDPEVRQGIINCLNWYTQFYQQGYVPPDAIHWLNPDNNRQLLNGQVVMTPNNSLSIPAAVRQDPEVYYEQIATAPYPNKPSGQPMRYLVIVRQAVVFKESAHQELAKDFLTYLIQPEVTGDYLKTAGGRNLPVVRDAWTDPFWTDPSDPHISAVAKILTGGQTRLFYITQHPAYALVLEENVWGKALDRMINGGFSAEQAADEAIARIQQIFSEWQ